MDCEEEGKILLKLRDTSMSEKIQRDNMLTMEDKEIDTVEYFIYIYLFILDAF